MPIDGGTVVAAAVGAGLASRYMARRDESQSHHIKAAQWLQSRAAEERGAAAETNRPRVQLAHERQAQELDRELDKTLRRMSPATRREFERDRSVELNRDR